MSDDPGQGIWRVWARDENPHEHAFDALVIFNHPASRMPGQRHVNLPVPYEGTVPDVPLTLVVRAHDDIGPIIVEYRGFAPDGSLRLVGRSSLPLVVIVRSATGIQVTGLPNNGATSVAQAP